MTAKTIAQQIADESAKTYRITYRRPSGEIVKTREFTGVALCVIVGRTDEWRELTGGTATYEVVEDGVTQYAVEYGNRFGNGQTVSYITEPWAYRPMAERDAQWKRSDGWDFADVVAL